MSEVSHADVIKDVGLFGLKTLLTLNAGASVVLLSFVGAMFGSGNAPLNSDLSNLKSALYFFLAGTFAALASLAITYVLAQLRDVRSPIVVNMRPFVFLAWMLVPAQISFICYGIGADSAISAIG